MKDNRSTSGSKKSAALKVVGTSAAILVVATATGMSPGVLAGAILGAALAIAFT